MDNTITCLFYEPRLVGYTGTPGHEHRLERSYTSATGENGPGCLLFPIRTAIHQRLPTRTTSRLYLQHKLSSGVPIERAPLTLATMYLYTDAGINVSLATLLGQTTG